MKNYIVITSIFRPTAAAVAFSRQPGHELVVVGDRKSPAEWEVDGVVYLSLTTQQSLGYRIGRYVPTDHYCRKMFGYLFAIAQQVGVIIDTDDDNHPLPNWHFPDFAGHFAVMPDQLGFLNIYELYTDKKSGRAAIRCAWSDGDRRSIRLKSPISMFMSGFGKDWPTTIPMLTRSTASPATVIASFVLQATTCWEPGVFAPSIHKTRRFPAQCFPCCICLRS